MFSQLRISLPTDALPTAKRSKSQISCISGTATTVTIAEVAKRHTAPVLLVVASLAAATQLYEELESFPELQVALFPDWETLPYDTFSPDQNTISQRLATLYNLQRLKRGLLIVPLTTLMQRLCPPSFIAGSALLLKNGQNLAPEELRQQLVQAGYRNVEQVNAQGEFAVRGSILDLFPMGSDSPYRLDFFDQQIDSIRTFDVDSQRSSPGTIQEVNLLPAREFAINSQSIELFRQHWRERFAVRREEEHLYQQVSHGTFPPGVEYWQPLFFTEPLVTLLDYLPNESLVLLLGADLEAAAQRFWGEIEQRFQSLQHDTMRPLLPPEELWLRVDQLFSMLKERHRLTIYHSTPEKGDASGEESSRRKEIPFLPLPNLQLQREAKNPLAPLKEFLQGFSGRVLFAVESQGRREVLSELLRRISITPKMVNQLAEISLPGHYIMVSAWQHGFLFPGKVLSGELALICESDLLGARPHSQRQQRRQTVNLENVVRHLEELRIGQAVTHLEHGIGRYGGLTTLEAGGIKGEYLIVRYEGESKLYVPVASLHLISRYSGGPEESAPLHKLGGDSWRRARQKALEKATDVAAELLDIYAQREAKLGFAYKLDQEEYRLFCQAFPFEETPDQATAINAVIADMTRANAMDRLICGDVGFGKTEVALRAAFIAVTNHKQVLLLVPTTLLAEQHGETFRDRFANLPVRVEILSRFRSRKEQQGVIEQLEKGAIDILIGTHKLLQGGLPLARLGLLIIDEEHRFGVQQKEKIKALRSEIDILTLTATPIPRTLNMAMSGMRDLSIIATPPTRRLAVKTFVRQQDPALIREALLREILRGGQVYYLHNEVKTIEQAAEKVRAILPEGRIAVAHGQMAERDLERVMNDFYHQRFEVLVCSTIIETGIDIPTANTIIIERADRFGLAQLHQLRGRVGRSHHQAYAYLLTPNTKLLTTEAQKRLEAITTLGDLGIGFALASHDLEIRGAGELLGADQSGQIAAIGFGLYQEMLHQAVAALKRGDQPSLSSIVSQQPEIELRVAALLPESYIGNVNLRLSFYKQISGSQRAEELEEIKGELSDRFGPLPSEVLQLLHIARMRQLAQQLAIRRIDGNSSGGHLEFMPQTTVDPSRLYQLLQSSSGQLKMAGATKLQWRAAEATPQWRLEFLEKLLITLSGQKEAVTT